ncbi:MAG TPA: GNAT family acetyltransferase [Phycisphaerae bacterium]|nr:GNAT family acetyltransferase [Phycisphaerae bacterium]
MNQRPTIRPFDWPDHDPVIALWQACGLVVPPNNPQKAIERKMKWQPDLFLVAESAGEILGTVMAGYEGHRGWINYMAVAPASQKIGIGRQLMLAAEEKLRALGCAKINLQIRKTNAQVMQFYERLGFTEDHDISMGKRLIDDPQ